MRFFKNGCGKPGIGVCFYNNGNEKKSLYIVGRGVLTPYFMKIPLYCLPSLFSNFVHLLPLSPTPSPTVLSVVLFLWLTGWSYYIWCAILLNVIMDLHMLSLGTLPPEGPWYVFHATRHQVYWAPTYNVVFY